MNFPKFWVRGGTQGFTAWGWSNESLALARSQGADAARRIADRLASGDRRHPGRYEYGDRPLREETLREFRDEAGALSAVITRNSHGCQILNTARLMFVDVDLGEETGRGGVLGWLLGGRKIDARREAARQSVLDRAEEWTRLHPGWGWRVYQTRAGLRLAAAHRAIAPDDPICTAAFDALGADPLYRRLCHHQKCFRARLTPKPWRCRLPAPPARWPFENETKAAAFQDWQKTYQEVTGELATCHLVARFGADEVASDLAELLRIHDEATRCHTTLALA